MLPSIDLAQLGTIIITALASGIVGGVVGYSLHWFQTRSQRKWQKLDDAQRTSTQYIEKIQISMIAFARILKLRKNGILTSKEFLSKFTDLALEQEQCITDLVRASMMVEDTELTKLYSKISDTTGRLLEPLETIDKELLEASETFDKEHSKSLEAIKIELSEALETFDKKSLETIDKELLEASENADSPEEIWNLIINSLNALVQEREKMQNLVNLVTNLVTNSLDKLAQDREKLQNSVNFTANSLDELTLELFSETTEILIRINRRFEQLKSKVW